MSKMTKRFPVLVVTLMILALVAAGCGGGDKKAEAPVANDIKIGANFELTGGQATFGQSSVNGRSREPNPPAIRTTIFSRVSGTKNSSMDCKPTRLPNLSTIGI